MGKQSWIACVLRPVSHWLSLQGQDRRRYNTSMVWCDEFLRLENLVVESTLTNTAGAGTRAGVTSPPPSPPGVGNVPGARAGDRAPATAHLKRRNHPCALRVMQDLNASSRESTEALAGVKILQHVKEEFVEQPVLVVA